jgi:ABC-2 type transport system ATP-binding protein
VATVIQTFSLNKVYEGAVKGNDVHALRDLSLTVDQGEIFAYLGPNGSGKTTTIKLLLGLIFPTSGRMEIMGNTDLGAPSIRKKIGYLPEGAYYPEFLRGEEVLKFYGQLYGLSGKILDRRVAEVTELVGMTKARKRMIRGYSKGMRQRIGLAQALLSDPQILILDEPTTGLDPIARKEIRDILVQLRNEGKTLLISSHELMEIEIISNRVGILFEGELKVQGRIDELLVDRDTVIQVTGLSPDARVRLDKVGVAVEDEVDGRLFLRVPAVASVYDALEVCKSEKVTLGSIRPRRETLEELFVRVVGDSGKVKE